MRFKKWANEKLGLFPDEIFEEKDSVVAKDERQPFEFNGENYFIEDGTYKLDKKKRKKIDKQFLITRENGLIVEKINYEGGKYTFHSSKTKQGNSNYEMIGAAITAMKKKPELFLKSLRNEKLDNRKKVSKIIN